VSNGHRNFCSKRALFDKYSKMADFLIENTEGRFTLEHKETGRAPSPRQFRLWGFGCCVEFLGLLLLGKYWKKHCLHDYDLFQ
jgi:hypothetical protein